MEDRPILFSAPMVSAILSGEKTQTRRVVKGNALDWLNEPVKFTPEYVACSENGLCPYGQIGDRLWVRETHWLDRRDKMCAVMNADGFFVDSPKIQGARGYIEDFEALKRNQFWSKKPSIHMPRWASRILLEIVDVRVERLQDISEADAIAEGVELDAIPANKNKPSTECLWRDYTCDAISAPSAKASFATLWESINGAGSWDANPWVWVIEFKRVES